MFARLCFLVASILGLFGSPAWAQSNVVRLGVFNAAASMLAPLLAEDLGEFKKNDVNVEMIGVNDPLQPLLAGSVDVIFAGPTTVVRATARGAKIRTLMTIYSVPGFALLVRPDVASDLKLTSGEFPSVITSLRGKKIGIGGPFGSVTDIIIRHMIRAAGLDPATDYSIVTVGAVQGQTAALISRQVDAIITVSPLYFQLPKRGEAVNVLDLTKYRGPGAVLYPAIQAIADDAWIGTHMSAAKGVVKAMTDTCAFVRVPANRPRVRELANARLKGMDPTIFEDVLDEFISACQPRFTVDDLKIANEFIKATGTSDTPLPDSFIVPGLTPQTN